MTGMTLSKWLASKKELFPFFFQTVRLERLSCCAGNCPDFKGAHLLNAVDRETMYTSVREDDCTREAALFLLFTNFRGHESNDKGEVLFATQKTHNAEY